MDKPNTDFVLTGVRETESSNADTPMSPINSKKVSNGLINKLFNRQSPKPLVRYVEDRYRSSNATNGSINDEDCMVMPCPYIRPLENKLMPRIEVSNRIPRSLRPHPVVTSSYRKAQTKRDAIYSDSAIAIGQALERPEVGSSSQSVKSLQGLQSTEIVATLATSDLSHFRAWNHYLKCYSYGQFNVNSPPDPPPMNPKFSYMPALFPVTEEQRLVAFGNCSTEWNDWTYGRARDLVLDALLKFDVPWASISFFDRNTELVMVELGYNRQFIPRQESIAAHILFSADVMVVPDTHKDWRFAGNPLVVGHKKIRFFAGAPLLSENGEAIGVFAVFGPDPREKFTISQRHDLSELGIVAAQDLTVMGRETIDDRRRDTPILQREDLIYGTATFDDSPKSVKHKQAEGFDFQLVPSPLQYHKTVGGCTNKSTNDTTSNLSVPTPPSSDDSDNDSVTAFHRSTKVPRKLSLKSRLNDDQDRWDLAPKSASLHSSSPRPFSSSDLTSVEDMARFCTPEPGSYMQDNLLPIRGDSPTYEHTSFESSLLVEQCSDLPAAEFAENLRASDASLPNSKVAEEERHNDASTKYVLPYADIHHNCTIAEGNSITTSINRASSSSISTDMTASDIGLNGTHVEADFAAALWAQNLDFDTIYVLDIFPNHPFMIDEEMKNPGAMGTRLLVSYGLGEDVCFSTSMHLQALRTDGIVIWDDDGCFPGEYRRGFMMTLAGDRVVAQNRSHGLIFGAFRKTPDDGQEAADITAAEIRRLRDAALVMKKILLKPIKDSSRLCQSEPSSPPGFPADEAIEVGKHSLDASTRRLEYLSRILQPRQS